jgi:hypothetical protein
MTPIILDPTTPPDGGGGTPSGGMSLSDAQNELMARGFDYLPQPRQTLMLNDAKNRFEDTWEFPWLYATTQGPAPLPITDLKYVLTVKTQTDVELLGIDIRGLAQNGTDLTQAGAPQCWYLTDGTLTTMRTWPVAETTLNVVYIRESPELVNPTDTPLIPPRYHPVWIDLAVIQALQDSDNYIAAQALQADVAVRLNELVLRYETRNRQNTQVMSIRAGSLDD